MILKFPVKVNYPLLNFIPAPNELLSGDDENSLQSSPVSPDGVVNRFVYFYEQANEELLMEHSPELSLPLMNVWYLQTPDEEFCGYYIHAKSPVVVYTNCSILAFSNGFKKSINSKDKPQMDLKYSTQYFSGFSSLSGCSMLVRQFNSEAFKQKLSGG